MSDSPAKGGIEERIEGDGSLVKSRLGFAEDEGLSVKNRTDLPPGPEPAAESSEEEVSGKADAESLRADAELAGRCVKGEVAAWEELYAQCHAPLLAAIRKMLGSQGGDLSLVDEMAARVWYALVEDDGQLLTRYNPKRGARLITFLRSLAKDHIVRHVRSEQRRRSRELKAARKRSPARQSMVAENDAALSEFLVSLTPAERSFTDSYLLAPPVQNAEGECSPHSTTSIWRLTANIRQKLIDFFWHP